MKMKDNKPKMQTSKTKAASNDWLDKIWEGLEYRAMYGRESTWAGLEAMQQNLTNSGADTGPNIINEMSEAIVSRMMLDQMYVTIGPSMLDPRSVNSYNIVQAIDNWLMEELGVSDVMGTVALHAYLYGKGIVKLGYDSQYGYSQKFDVTPDDPSGMTLSQFDSSGKRIEFNNINPGMPWMMPVLPHDFVVPWGTKNLTDAPWCAHRFYRHIDDIKKDVKYKNTSVLKPNLSMQDIIRGYQTTGKTARELRARRQTMLTKQEGTGNAEFVEFWEIHVRSTGKVIVVSDQDEHRNEIDAMQVDGLPFKDISFIKHPRSFWSTPQAEYLKFHQLEQNDIVKQASIQRRMNSFKILMKETMMTEPQLEAMLSPEAGIVAFVNAGADLRNDMSTVPQAQNLALFQDMQFTKGNAREAIGFSRNQLGEFDQSSRRTATEAGLVDQGSQFRSEPRQAAVRKLYTECFRFMNQTIFKFWKTPRHIQIPDGSFPDFIGEELQAEYSYKMSVSPSPTETQAQKEAKAFNLYMSLAQDPRVNQSELIQYLIRCVNDPSFARIFSKDEMNPAQGLGDPNANLQLPVPQ